MIFPITLNVDLPHLPCLNDAQPTFAFLTTGIHLSNTLAIDPLTLNWYMLIHSTKLHIGSSPYQYNLLMLLSKSIHYTNSSTSPPVSPPMVCDFFDTMNLHHKHYHKQTTSLHTDYNLSCQQRTSCQLL